MNARLSLIAAAACLCLTACGGGGGDGSPDPDAGQNPPPSPVTPIEDSSVAGELLLRLTDTAQLAGVLADHGLSALEQFGRRPIYRVGVAEGRDPDALLTTLRTDSRVQRATHNRVAGTPEGRRRSVWAIGEAGAYSAQWAPQAIGLPQAHAISTGAGVRIAMLDTGVDTAHPALAGRLAAGYDFVDGDADPSEAGSPGDAGYGHGTHVAGLLALAAPGATLMPLRVLDAQGHGNVWVIAEALLYAIDPDGNPDTPDGAQVINLSLGTTQETDLLEDIIDLVNCAPAALVDPDPDDDDDDDDDDERRCVAQGGTVVVAAAGNDGSDSLRQYPAAEEVDGSLSVGATAVGDLRADFSNFGDWVTIAAPGEGITSTVPGGGYGVWSGTSMSAPLVAGVAALLRAAQPGLEPEELTDRMIERSVRLCDLSMVRVDAVAALQDTEPTPLTCP